MDDATSFESRIIAIVREESREPERTLHRDDQLYDLLDSLGKVEVVMAVEDEFEIAVPDADTEQLKTVGDLIDYIERHVRAQPAAAGVRDAGESSD